MVNFGICKRIRHLCWKESKVVDKAQFVNLYGKICSYAPVKRTLMNCKIFTKFGVEVEKISLSSRQPISALFAKSKL